MRDAVPKPGPLVTPKEREDAAREVWVFRVDEALDSLAHVHVQIVRIPVTLGNFLPSASVFCSPFWRREAKYRLPRESKYQEQQHERERHRQQSHERPPRTRAREVQRRPEIRVSLRHPGAGVPLTAVRAEPPSPVRRVRPFLRIDFLLRSHVGSADALTPSRVR